MVSLRTPGAKNVLVENRFQQSLAMYFGHYFHLNSSVEASRPHKLQLTTSFNIIILQLSDFL